MRCMRGARRLRRCGHCLFVLMDSGHLSVTMLSFVGILRSVRLLVEGILMMIFSRTTTLLLLPLPHLQTNQTMKEDVLCCLDGCMFVFKLFFSEFVRFCFYLFLRCLGAWYKTQIITSNLFTNEKEIMLIGS
uniref:Uncharacterized protein At1g67350 n=1 Tax=Arabidopsis thaliana TaxID=3702 RepID=Q0WSK6_ARATH|nr:hypothetical protein [Arabidopsis thaliana]